MPAEPYNLNTGSPAEALLIGLGLSVDHKCHTSRRFHLPTYVKHVPENVSAINSDSWVEELELVDIHVPKSEIGRYLFWIKFVAIVDTSDLQKIAEQFGMQMGISEGEVQEHLSSSFPDQPVQ